MFIPTSPTEVAAKYEGKIPIFSFLEVLLNEATAKDTLIEYNYNADDFRKGTCAFGRTDTNTRAHTHMHTHRQIARSSMFRHYLTNKMATGAEQARFHVTNLFLKGDFENMAKVVRICDAWSRTAQPAFCLGGDDT